MTIWRRYFFKEIITTFSFLLFAIYALYIVLDLMSHLKDLRENQTSIVTWITFYACTLSRRLDTLLPFIVLIGSIRVLISFQTQNLLTILLTGGISMKRLYEPFITVAVALSLLLYVNYQWILPVAQPLAIEIQESDFSQKEKEKSRTDFSENMLQDGSKLLYKAYDPVKKELQQVFWIESLDRLYYMQALSCTGSKPEAKNVDVITRSTTGQMKKTSSLDSLLLEKLEIDEQTLSENIIPPRDQSLTKLISQVSRYHPDSDRAHDMKANFFFKLSYPLMTLLAFLSVAPFCLSFRRRTPYFMIYLLGICLLFCFLLLLQVTFVLAKSGLVASWLAFTLLWLTAFFAVRMLYKRQQVL